MKKLVFIFIAGSILYGCGTEELKRDEALRLINKERGYPRVIDYDIFCGDPEQAGKLLHDGLEEKGMVTIQRTQKLKDIGKPLVHFTDKAKPYLLPTPEKDKAINVQKVKIAVERLTEITAVISDREHNSAIVEYTTVYENPTPFAVFSGYDVNTPKKHKAYFVLADVGWVMEANGR